MKFNIKQDIRLVLYTLYIMMMTSFLVLGHVLEYHPEDSFHINRLFLVFGYIELLLLCIRVLLWIIKITIDGQKVQQ